MRARAAAALAGALALCGPAMAAPPQAPASAAASEAAGPKGDAISHGLFSDVRIVRPAGAVQHFAMLLVGDATTSPRERRLVERLAAAGAMVAIVPLAPFWPRLQAQSGMCTYAAGAFENLSRHLQAYERLPTYLTPILVGADDSAAVVYALLAQAPAGIFASGLSDGFCPRLVAPLPPCAANALRWKEGTRAGGVDLLPPPAQLADLPIVEVPAAAANRASGLFAVLLSGDGGWAGIDKSLGVAFAAQGIPVAGFDSLRYFWSARTPEGLAADLDRVIRYYAARWGRDEVVLVGYSQGADVLPFALNRLPPATRATVRLAALLGPGQKAAFEFHVSNWLGASGDLAIAPEARKLAARDTLCLYGLDEKDSLCPELAPEHARAMPLAGGHHFGGDYDALAARILAAVPR